MIEERPSEFVVLGGHLTTDRCGIRDCTTHNLRGLLRDAAAKDV
jgi:hypothetical protein